MPDISLIIGSAGVFLLLVAFFLNLFKILPQNSKNYLILNIAGGGLAFYSAVLIGFVPFIILEGLWTLVSIIGLVKVLV